MIFDVLYYFCRLLPDLTAEEWTGWWYKAYLFSPECGLSGPVMYLDLDTILCSSIDFLVNEVMSSIHLLRTPDTVTPKVYSSCDVLTVVDSSTKESTSTHIRDSMPSFFGCLKASEITNEGMSVVYFVLMRKFFTHSSIHSLFFSRPTVWYQLKHHDVECTATTAIVIFQ